MADEGMHMAELALNECKAHVQQKMGSTILDSYTQLTNQKNIIRLRGAITLLRHLSQQNSDDDDNKEVKYALTRLIRTLGSSKVCSRKGFYTTLTVFLTQHPETSIERMFSIMDTELRPVGSNNKGENADIYMGRILACGALIRSKVLLKNSIDIQHKVIETLINGGKERSYLSYVSVSFLAEFLDHLDDQSIKASIWPLLEKEFGKPWSKQTLDTLYILLVMRNKFPSLVNHKFLKKHLGTEDIITKECLEDIIKVLTGLPRIISYLHPVFKLFCEQLVSTELIADFWMGIDKKFIKPSKSDEYVAVEMMRLILLNVTDGSVLPSLLSPNFLQYMLKKFSNCKKNNNDESLTAFRKCLIMMVSITNKDVKTKTQICLVKKLILYPGDLMIEKRTGTRVVQLLTGNLNSDGVKKLSKVYRGIIENVIPPEKGDTNAKFWTNAERTYAAQMLTKLMGHPEIISEYEWRIEQLKLLFNYGLCEVSNVGLELARKYRPYRLSHSMEAFSTNPVNIFAAQLKETFYRALDHKLPKLDDLRNMLSILVHHINQELNSNAIKLRTPLNDEAVQAWKKMIQLVDKLEKNNTKASPIFHTMNLHMGLQLFSDPEMAIASINELQCCRERLVKKPKKQKEINDDEPEWVEVVVDLLLSLLSRNNHLLRSLVACVFPHTCPYLTANAVHQILAVLDVKSDKGPLTLKDDVASNMDTDSDENTDNDNDNEEDNEDDDDKDNDNDATETEDSDSNAESLDEEETVNDKLRQAVSQALGDASMQTDDEDVDVDQIGEEEGKRLDESLAAAFRILRENRQSRSKKQEKSAQALTHFRGRVMDLLETYVEFGPSMAIALDMLLPLFALLEFCIKDPHQKPLENRVRSCLKKLSTVKKFKDTNNVDEELLTTVLKALIEKGERSASVCQEMGDKLAECCTFLVRCIQQTGLSTEALIKIYEENLTAFFRKRDSVLPAVLFRSILQLCWEGNWTLAPLLVDFAFDSSIRPFRRGQALEFLTIFYRNDRLIKTDTAHTKIRINMEKKLYRNTVKIFEELCNSQKSENGQSSSSSSEMGKDIRQKFVYLLLVLLRAVHTHHLPQVWNWTDVANILMTYRTQASLAKDAKSAYKKLATQIGIVINVPTEATKDESTSNINGQAIKENGEKEEEMKPLENGNITEEEDVLSTKKKEKKRKKQKGNQRNKQLLKKEARELRAKAMSEGLESFNFSSAVLPEESNESEEELPNGITHDERPIKSTPKKRAITKENDAASKPKRKKNSKYA